MECKKRILRVKCTRCGNRRLFDLLPETEGTIKIKCPRCGAELDVTIHKRKIRLEQTDAC